MKTKEDLKGIVIHCPTSEEAKQVCSLAHELGWEWKNGESYSDYTYWKIYEKDSCYNFDDGTHYDYKRINRNCYQIKSSQWFLDNFTPNISNLENIGKNDKKDKETEETFYKSCVWLNKDSSSSTSNIVCYYGKETYEGKEYDNMFIKISDCHHTIKLHKSGYDSKQDFIKKLELLESEIDKFIEILK